jgi:hypothetical protein
MRGPSPTIEEAPNQIILRAPAGPYAYFVVFNDSDVFGVDAQALPADQDTLFTAKQPDTKTGFHILVLDAGQNVVETIQSIRDVPPRP